MNLYSLEVANKKNECRHFVIGWLEFGITNRCRKASMGKGMNGKTDRIELM